jgi:hypothetical protein
VYDVIPLTKKFAAVPAAEYAFIIELYSTLSNLPSGRITDFRYMGKLLTLVFRQTDVGSNALALSPQRMLALNTLRLLFKFVRNL